MLEKITRHIKMKTSILSVGMRFNRYMQVFSMQKERMYSFTLTQGVVVDKMLDEWWHCGHLICALSIEYLGSLYWVELKHAVWYGWHFS